MSVGLESQAWGEPSTLQWVDVAGPPGVGKSTICDPLWTPHAFRPKDDLPLADWQSFLDEITRLLGLIRDHWSFVPAVRMNRRSVRKMATVARMEGAGPYIQTGFVQRGLGFGWRLNELGADLNEIRRYFQLMPVSLGVAVLTTSVETIIARNRLRPVENRDFMAPLMQEPIRIAKETLIERGVRLVEIDTEHQSADAARSQLVAFASAQPGDAAQMGLGSKMATVPTPPAWW